jgi:dTMP kinase
MVQAVPGGRLIVIEGIDGTGKTTLCRGLTERLAAEGWDVARLREPTDGPFGRRIRELARTGRDGVTPREELDLFLNDRRENARDHIVPALARGAVVLMDRYYFSTIAYQGARGLDPGAIRRENEAFAPAPDLLLYLTIPIEWVGRRIEHQRGAVRDHFEHEDYLRRVQAIFDTIKHPAKVTIDATCDALALLDVCLAHVHDCLSRPRL